MADKKLLRAMFWSSDKPAFILSTAACEELSFSDASAAFILSTRLAICSFTASWSLPGLSIGDTSAAVVCRIPRASENSALSWF
jgi:hypothetical protein